MLFLKERLLTGYVITGTEAAGRGEAAGQGEPLGRQHQELSKYSNFGAQKQSISILP